MSWNSIVILICVLLAAFGLYREYQREAKLHLGLRLAATVAAVIALACLVLPISYSGSKFTATGKSKILLTPGFIKDSLSNTGADSIYTLDAALHGRYPKAKLLDNAAALFTDSTRTTPVHIYGYGLDNSELMQLNDQPVIFHPSPAPDGFAAISWTDELKTGQQFQAQGKYQNTSAKAIQLVLKGLHTTLDSVSIPAKTSVDFTLRTTPKNAGRAVYALLAITNNRDTLQQEELPLTINHTQPLKVLILSASPDFESKFLKNWLGENGYSVATRSAISKDKFSQEYVNMDQPNLAHLSAALLSKFDVLIGDLSVLKTLPQAESGLLQQEVMQKGLGIIIREDSTGRAASWLQGNFTVTHLTGKQAAPGILTIAGKGKTARLNLNPVYINPQNNIQAVITGDAGHILAAATIAGAGKLVYTTVNNTHNWMLAGNKDDYRALWSALIDKAARRLPVPQRWQATSSQPTVNQPVQLVTGQLSPAGNININQTPVYPAQNRLMPFQHVVTYWPAAYGWQQVTANAAAPYWWYAWQAGSWPAISAAKKLSLTSQCAQQHTVAASVTKQIQQKTRVSVPKIYFYILFLMAASFLWAESKFFS